MKLIEIKSEAQRAMLERCAEDGKEAARRGMTVEQAKASLEAHGLDLFLGLSAALPKRLGPERPNRHGSKR